MLYKAYNLHFQFFVSSFIDNQNNQHDHQPRSTPMLLASAMVVFKPTSVKLSAQIQDMFMAIKIINLRNLRYAHMKTHFFKSYNKRSM